MGVCVGVFVFRNIHSPVSKHTVTALRSTKLCGGLNSLDMVSVSYSSHVA